MPEKLSIKSESGKILVALDQEANRFEFSGRLLLVNPPLVFDTINDWFQEYFRSPNPETILTFQLEYLNSASIRAIAEMLTELEALNHNQDHIVKIRWYYDADDDIIKEKGEELDSILSLDFEFIENS